MYNIIYEVEKANIFSHNYYYANGIYHHLPIRIHLVTYVLQV